jgi:hypothetical protein
MEHTNDYNNNNRLNQVILAGVYVIASQKEDFMRSVQPLPRAWVSCIGVRRGVSKGVEDG